MNEVELFKRLVDLESEKLTITADIKQLKEDAKYDEETNPKGIAKDEIKLIAAAARLEAQNQYEEKKAAADAVFKKYAELTGYDD